MTYRDDHDAALRRTEALERELEELRRKHATLEQERAKVDEALEARRELEELARRKPARQPEPPRRAPRAARSEGDERVHVALSHGWWVGPLTVVMMLSGLVVFAVAFGGHVMAAGLFAGVALAFPVLIVSQRLLARQQRRWLARLPFQLPNYLEYLAAEHPADTVMTVTVEVEVSDAGDRKVVADAVVGATGAQASFHGSRLVIRSPAIHARFANKRGRARTRPQNHLLHSWFKKLVRRALLPVARAHRITRVDVT